MTKISIMPRKSGTKQCTVIDLDTMVEGVWALRGLFYLSNSKFQMYYRVSQKSLYKGLGLLLGLYHLICKIFSGMFQKSSSFKEFNGFSEIDVHFFE